MARVEKTTGLAILICTLGLLAFGLWADVTRAQTSTPGVVTPGAVNPGDISTPTPTAQPILVPTPVAAPDLPPGTRAYRVRAGDTLLAVALETGVDLEETYCLVAPDFTWAQPLVIGDLLTVPEPGTRCHTIALGETLADVAAAYGVTSAAIAADPWNGPAMRASLDGALPAEWHLRIPPRRVTANAQLMGDAQDSLPLLLSQAPNADPSTALAVATTLGQSGLPAVGGAGYTAMAPVPADWPYGTGLFAWPLYGWMTQGFKTDHRAIDIAAPVGTVVTAADRGVVIRAGWNSQGYGQFVIVDHNIDYITLYAHLNEVLVSEGDVVAQGQPIGRVGSSGNSTGPHLHFEVRDFGQRVDPVPLLLR